MHSIKIRLCLAARQLAQTHGAYYAASLLCEQAIPLYLARIFLTYSEEALSCIHVATLGEDEKDGVNRKETSCRPL
jgi:hypothetical protein